MSKTPNKSGDDIVRLSQAMDALAKLIISKQKDGSQLQVEYTHKLKELENVINLLLGLNEGTGDSVMDTGALDVILRNSIEVLEKGDQKYALIPIKPREGGGSTRAAWNATTKKSSNKKKNRIKCSFCHQPGHTRAHCEVRLAIPPKE
ncbi:hypothetical protein SKDZ_05G2160 [Saccharomyces kudriavzevii ZP591]|uniref:YER137C-like protein n=1 Tax=Saccharomyces cerevisiae x Saccharomyces kudriavzevii (strain VIN7) TaxID=1095631 RepID=H0GU27_SACCK|nr:YER137C-like protein [Saccharomyces cerevisiae x Saccharomyces kudriavzevii VIN7]CAI4060610.1 hypothetical protein SKDZ_05G2160 [Saccharomyces kudriavzevii ZP591]